MLKIGSKPTKKDFLAFCLLPLGLGFAGGNFYTSALGDLTGKQTASGDRVMGDFFAASPPAAPESNRLPDGVYLYGESAQPEQIQKTYLVFEVRRGLAIGAIYMPSSSFDCFYGPASSQQLDLTIVNSYEQISYPYSILLQKLYPINSVSANDQRILGFCKDTYQEQIWSQ